MTTVETRNRYDECLSASWLSARLGLDTVRIDTMRRSGELIAVRPEGSPEWLYPAWQFRAGRPRQGVDRVVAAGREAGLDENRLFDAMIMRMGLGSERRLADLLAAGEIDRVIAALRG